MEAESEGHMDDVDMEKVEMMVLNPEVKSKSVGHPNNIDELEENKRRNTETESEGSPRDVKKQEMQKLIPYPETEMESVRYSCNIDVEKQKEAINDFELNTKWRKRVIYVLVLLVGVTLFVILLIFLCT